MQLNFEGRIAVVTGGASGIGLATAARLKQEGARVVILDRDKDALAHAAGEGGMIPLLVDVSDRAASANIVEQIETEQGPIAILVTAAGILAPPRPPEHISEQAWHNTLAVNLDGTRIACQIIGTRMAARGEGSIVTIASIAAFEPGPLVVYGPAKAAIVGLTKALAGAWGRRGVRVNAVAPGYVLTPPLRWGVTLGFVEESRLSACTALGRLTRADEVANAIAFLASDAAAAITGVVLPVDAGQLLAGGWAPFGGFAEPEA
jgi:NAD(P)-dependent dehydrogenase (short-subunit alcohol dehydrogenase family)